MNNFLQIRSPATSRLISMNLELEQDIFGLLSKLRRQQQQQQRQKKHYSQLSSVFLPPFLLVKIPNIGGVFIVRFFQTQALSFVLLPGEKPNLQTEVCYDHLNYG